MLGSRTPTKDELKIIEHPTPEETETQHNTGESKHSDCDSNPTTEQPKHVTFSDTVTDIPQRETNTESNIETEPTPPTPPIRRSSRRTKSNQNYKDPTRTGWWRQDTNVVEAFNFNVHSDYEVYAAHQFGDIRATSIYTPKDYDDALQSSDKTLWLESMEKENESIKENQVYTKMKITDLPKGANIISGKWVFKVKPTSTGKVSRYKSRIVARGFQGRYGVDYAETYSPVAVASTIRLLLAISASMGLHLRGADVKTAFLYAEQVRPVYFKPPKGADCEEDEVWLLKKALYGLKDAPLRWHQTLSTYLKNIGLQQAKSDPCLFFKRTREGQLVLMTITVDDILIAASTKELAEEVINKMKDKFTITDLGEPDYVIGIHIDYDRPNHILKLNQKLYIETIAEKFGQTTGRPEIIPAPVSVRISKDMGSPPTTKPYRSLIGSLIYATLTRPDVCTIVSQLSSVLENPQEAHWNAGIRVLRYLYNTRDRSLTYNPDEIRTLTLNWVNGYTDSTWNTEEKSRSRTGYICLFNGCAISWKSKKQGNIAKSSCEAEYIALNEGGAEIIWLRKLLTELGLQDSTKPSKVWVDNLPAIQLAKHQMVKHRTKHIKLKYDWIREQIEEGSLNVTHRNTKENLADLFTKNLPRVTFEKFISQIID